MWVQSRSPPSQRARYLFPSTPNPTNMGKYSSRLAPWCQLIPIVTATHSPPQPPPINVMCNKTYHWLFQLSLTQCLHRNPCTPVAVKSTSRGPWTLSWCGQGGKGGRWHRRTRRCTIRRFRRGWGLNGSCWQSLKNGPSLMKRRDWGKSDDVWGSGCFGGCMSVLISGWLSRVNKWIGTWRLGNLFIEILDE